jgi:X-Pro dipeptidyl-peptidase
MVSGTAAAAAEPVPAAPQVQNPDTKICDQGNVAAVAADRKSALASQAKQAAPQPETMPQCDLSQAITQTIDIVSGAKRPDGTPARVQLRLKRPKTLPGVTIPTIIEPSPYNGHASDTLGRHANTFAQDATPPLGQAIQQQIDKIFADASGADNPNREDLPVTATADPTVPADAKWDMTYEAYFDNYFVPRGYAVADLDAVGTGNSQGCVDPGSASEQAGITAAIDWLNGRATGYGENGNEITAADWSNGKVALKGKSYDGALSIEGAAAKPQGLKTILSVAGIADWYDYTRFDGVVTNPSGSKGYDLDNLATYVSTGPDRHSCNDTIASNVTAHLERDTGQRNAYWDARNYTTKVTADQPSVFLVQGVNDPVVRPSQSVSYWQALQNAHVPSKLWVTQGLHYRPYNQRPYDYVRQVHQWFDYWLDDVDNHVLDQPKVDVQGPDLTSWTTQDSWPAAGTAGVKLTFNSDGSLGKNAKLPFVRQQLTDDGVTKTTGNLIDPDGASNAQSLAYLSPALDQDVTLQGAPSFTVNAALNGPSPYLTALLVDYGPQGNNYYTPDTRYDTDTRASQKLCTGQSIASNDPCVSPYSIFFHTTPENYKYNVITRGWADIRHWMRDRHQAIVVDGQPTTVTWKAEPTNYTVPKGHRIGVVLLATDNEQVSIFANTTYTPHYTGADNDPTTLGALTGFSSVTLPVTTGSDALGG